MTEIERALQTISESTISSVALRSQDPLEALYRINPEIASIAYAHKGDILTPTILPFVTRFRELQSEEKIALVRGLVEKHRIDTMGNVAVHQSDNELRGIQSHEEGETERTGIIQNGMTTRTNIVQDGLTKRNETSELARTQRKRIEMQGLLDLQNLEYEARVRMLNDHIEGQKYLSDNQLRAVYAEAEAYKQAIEAREGIRANARMKISGDRLEERVKIASIDFAKKILEAEMHRNTAQYKERAEVVKQYIQSQTELCLETFRAQAEAENTNKRYHESVHKTVREGIIAIKETALSGKSEVSFVIDIFGDRIVLDYKAK